MQPGKRALSGTGSPIRPVDRFYRYEYMDCYPTPQGLYHQPAWSLGCILCYQRRTLLPLEECQPGQAHPAGQGRRAAKVSSTNFWNLLRTYKDNLPSEGETILDQPVFSWTALTAQWTVQQIYISTSLPQRLGHLNRSHRSHVESL